MNNNGAKREAGWSAAGECREKASAAYDKFMGEAEDVSLVELAMARDYAVVERKGKKIVDQVNKAIGAAMRKIVLNPEKK